MIEFGLLLPVLMLMILGLTDIARAVYSYNIISNVAREGAREAILGYNKCSNTSTSACGPAPSAGATIIGVDNAVTRAGAGLVAYRFATDATGARNAAPCTPLPNQACVWVFITNGTTTSGCTPPNPQSNPGGTDNWGNCDFNASKQGGHSVVVEIEYKFQPLTALMAGVIGNASIFWAKSEMKTEY